MRPSRILPAAALPGDGQRALTTGGAHVEVEEIHVRLEATTRVLGHGAGALTPAWPETGD
ncbi:Hypothetical protein A7982_04545 [Minicystis rosea]|nr:Hypothetical protein A7982_04545 [Minicystis rosea]